MVASCPAIIDQRRRISQPKLIWFGCAGRKGIAASCLVGGIVTEGAEAPGASFFRIGVLNRGWVHVWFAGWFDGCEFLMRCRLASTAYIQET